MTWEMKRAFGKLLGEIYRLQQQAGMPTEAEATIYGLLNGMEHVIDNVLGQVGFVSWESFENAVVALRPYFEDPEERAALTGFDALESELLAVGVDRESGLRTFGLLERTMPAGFVSNGFLADRPETQRSLIQALHACFREDEEARAPRRDEAEKE